MSNADLTRADVILLVFGHLDDESFLAAGTVARYAAASPCCRHHCPSDDRVVG